MGSKQHKEHANFPQNVAYEVNWAERKQLQKTISHFPSRIELELPRFRSSTERTLITMTAIVWYVIN